MKRTKQILALLLAVLMIVPTLAACKHEDVVPEGEINATPVQYSRSGVYTTTISSDKGKLTGLTVDNIEVRYSNPYKNLLTVSGLTETLEGEEKETTLEDLLPEKATVNSVTANANGGYDISFTDANAETYTTTDYMVLLKNTNDYAEVKVDFPTITLTPDVESVFLGTKQFRVALTIDGSEFEDTLSEEDLYQDNAFARVDMEIISKSNNNLTLEIKGDFVKNEADCYQWGTIGVLPTGIKNAYDNVEAKINVILDYAGIDATSLKFANSKITADLKVYGVAGVDTLTKDNVTIEGVTVESLTKADDNTVRLTLSAADVKSVNDFVDLVSGRTMKLGEYETAVLLSQANFYPVFDYIEKVDNNFDLTLKLYIYGGTIDNTLTADKIELGSDFEGAAVKSVTVDENNLATLILNVPCGGFTEDNYQFDGDITLKAGAVTNAWGEKTSIDCTFARNYSAESLGRDVTLNTDTLSAIADYTKGLDTTFGKVCYYAGVAGQVFGIVKNVAEMAGIVKSEHQQVMDKLEEMDQKLTIVQADVAEIKQVVNGLAYSTKYYAREELRRDLQTKIDGFETTLLSFDNALNVVKSIYDRAAFDMAIEDAIAAGKLTEKPSFTGMTSEEIAAEKDRLRALYLPNEDAMTDLEVAQYNVRIIQYINEKAKDANNFDYYGYTTYVMSLEETFKVICGMLEKSSGSNPIGFYDELVAQIYNFDSQTYDFRLANRVTLQYKLINAIGVLAFHYQVAAYPDSYRYQLIGTAFDKAMKSNIWTVSGHPASEIKANPHKATEGELSTYIGEVMLGGAANDEDAKKVLTDNGYTVILSDLNRGAGGHYIYLGYKTTQDPKQAISAFYIAYQKHPESVETSEGTAYPVPYDGDQDFIDGKGDCNTGCKNNKKHKWAIYIYYIKNATATGKAVANIWFGSKYSDKTGAVGRSLNTSVGGYVVYMHADTIPIGLDPSKVGTVIETNPEYYPYSYMFGRKVSFYVSDKLAVDYDAELKSISGVKTSWTDNEIKEFIDRCQQTNLFNGELSSAGVRMNQMYNGGGTSVLYVNLNYNRAYSKPNKRYYIDMDLMLMDDRTTYRWYVKDSYRDLTLGIKGNIYYWRIKADSQYLGDRTNTWNSAMYFILH